MHLLQAQQDRTRCVRTPGRCLREIVERSGASLLPSDAIQRPHMRDGCPDSERELPNQLQTSERRLSDLNLAPTRSVAPLRVRRW
jgi:hypothetical protein